MFAIPKDRLKDSLKAKAKGRMEAAAEARRPFKAPGGAGGLATQYLPRIICVLAIYALCIWIAVPLFAYALCYVRYSGDVPYTLSEYVDGHLLGGWGVLGNVADSATPAMVATIGFTIGAAVLALALLNQLLAGTNLKNVFGPAFSKTNAKGSARLFTHEGLLAEICETWDGDWEHPPRYGSMVMGYSKKLGKYYVAPEEAHTITFGSTGAGKTSRVNLESLDCMLAAGDSVVALDPKGELYGKTSKAIRAHGVKVLLLDLAHPERSNCLNPLSEVTRTCLEYRRISDGHIERAVRIAEAEGIPAAEKAMDPGAWEGHEAAYAAFSEAMQEADFAKQLAWSKAQNLVADIGEAIVPERPDAGAGKHWEDTARTLLKSLILFVATYVEDDYIGDGEPFSEPFSEQRTLESVRNLLAEYGGVDASGAKVLGNILKKIDHDHPAYELFGQARTSEKKEYETAVAESIKFLDMYLTKAINSILATSDFDLREFGRRQAVLFIVVPDGRPALGALYALVMNQLYQALIMEAEDNAGELPVRVHFLCEELGNIRTPIPALANHICVARSYGMRFHITLQSSTQLNEIYGEEAMRLLLSQCGVRMMLKCEDADGTGKYFSENMGKYTYTGTRSSRTRDAFSVIDNNASMTVQEEERALLDPSEVTRWNPEWGAIVLLSKTGRKPGLKARLFGWEGVLMPCVFPTSPAWETPTSKNLDIHGKEHNEGNVEAARQELRLSERVPSSKWIPVALDADERAHIERMLERGGVSELAEAAYAKARGLDIRKKKAEAVEKTGKAAPEERARSENSHAGRPSIGRLMNECREKCHWALRHSDCLEEFIKRAAEAGVTVSEVEMGLHYSYGGGDYSPESFGRQFTKTGLIATYRRRDAFKRDAFARLEKMGVSAKAAEEGLRRASVTWSDVMRKNKKLFDADTGRIPETETDEMFAYAFSKLAVEFEHDLETKGNRR